MKTHIGLSDEARLEVGRILNLTLAEEYVLFTTIKDYHWNVTGPEFSSLHLQFDIQAAAVLASIDDIAERARAIGVGARGNWADLAKAARSSADAGTGLPAEGMLAELLTLHEGLIVQLRADIEACATLYKDVGNADFLTGLLKAHEKTAWLLRSQLETEEAETA